LRHINISLLWVQEQEKLKKLVYEKVPGQDNPADLFTKGVGREKLQQFAWASGQIFLDGRADTSLQAQGVGLSKVGIGSVPCGILCVSSGSDNSVNPAGIQRAPNAADTKRIQYNKSKNSELAHADIIVGKLKCITEKHMLHSTRPIGSTPTSGVRPNWWWYPRRKCRGEAVGDVHKSAHAQFVNWDRVNQIGAMSLRERLGQCNFGIPRPLQTHWRLIQGGVVEWESGFGQWGVSTDSTVMHKCRDIKISFCSLQVDCSE